MSWEEGGGAGGRTYDFTTNGAKRGQVQIMSRVCLAGGKAEWQARFFITAAAAKTFRKHEFR